MAWRHVRDGDHAIEATVMDVDPRQRLVSAVEEGQTQQQRRHLILLVLLISPLWAVNGYWDVWGNTDVVAANVASWQLVSQGTLDLGEYPVIADHLDELDRWFVEREDGSVVSNRAPGLIAIGVPVYAVLGTDAFRLAPGTALALLLTMLAVVILWRLIIPLAGLNAATASAVVVALGTTTWWISSAQLWPHGPGQFFAALALAAIARGSYGWAGWAFAGSVLVRPISGVFAATVGIVESLRRRSVLPALKMGAATAVGVGLLAVYNHLVFGAVSLRGGYSSAFTTGAIERFTVAWYLENVWAMFAGIPHGFLVMSPILGVGLAAAIRFRGYIPRWAWTAAGAAAAYLLVHAALNRASGGLGMFYRYPLEPIVLAGPVFAVGATAAFRAGGWWKRTVVWSAACSLFLQAFNVFFLICILDPAANACLLP